MTGYASQSVEEMKGRFLDPYNNEKFNQSLRAIKQFAEEELKCKLVHVALAWAIHYQHLDSALISARTVEQLQESL